MCISNYDSTKRHETIWVTNSQNKLSHRLWSCRSEIYLHWSYLLIALLDEMPHFLFSLFILCSSSCEIITLPFMFILTMSLVKMIFMVWVSIWSFCCLFFIGVDSCSLTWICFPESLEASFWIFSNFFSNSIITLNLFEPFYLSLFVLF